MARDPWRLAVASAVVAALSVALLAAQPGGGKRYALLVGVRDYDRGELRSLKYTENDVTALRDLLKASEYERVVLLTQAEGTRRSRFLPTASNIRAELRGLLEDRQSGDTVMVAFTGHGVQFKGESQNYFCPMDARLDDKKTLVSLSEVYGELRDSKAGVKLLFVDACRNDPQSDLSKDAGGDKLESVTKPQLQRPPGGVAALFSCSPGQKSYESDDLKHGIFFYHVIQGLKGKAANSDGTVGFDDLVSYAKRKVPDFVKDDLGPRFRQVPHSLNDLVGAVVLATGATPRANAAAKPAVGRTGPEASEPPEVPANHSLVEMKTTEGTIWLELYSDKAPLTVENFVTYVRANHYDGTLFHRVMPGFMIQGGGFDAAGRERPTRAAIKTESDNGLSNSKYTLAAARTARPDTTTAQFYINHADNTYLDRERAADKVGYCVFGKVARGTQVIDRIAGVKTGPKQVNGTPFTGWPVRDVTIITARVSRDAPVSVPAIFGD